MTISDKKKGIADPLNAALIKFFEPIMLSGTDYYPFGMPMRIGGDSSYRYGFNGKENDNEVKGGDGLQQDYGMRVYDNRIGKFLSVDPLADDYPSWSPYSFAMNRPIDGVDLAGLEWQSVKDKDGKVTDYKYVGFDEKGNPKKGSESGGPVMKGNVMYLFGSQVLSKNPETGHKLSVATLSIVDNDLGTITSINISDRAKAFNVKYTSLSTGENADFPVYSGEQATNKLKNGFTGLSGVDLEGEAHHMYRLLQITTPKGGGIESLGLGPVELLLGFGEIKMVKSVFSLAASKAIGYTGLGYTKLGVKMFGDKFLKLHPRLTTPSIRGYGFEQLDAGHRATTFFRSEIMVHGKAGVKNWKTIYYNLNVNGQPLSIGINPWRRTIFHEGPGVFKK